MTPKTQRVRLLKSWMAHPAGTELDVTRPEAALLVMNKTAEMVTTKAIDSPPENKAILHAPNRKRKH